MELDYDRLVALRKQSAAWRLLKADNAALMLSFFNKVFVEQGARSIAGAELVERLDDELFALNGRLGQGTFPKSAKAYLDDWSGQGNGWLRKYYPPDLDEPHYDATAAVEKAIAWVRSLEERSFVGTESRLNTIFDLLRQMTFGTETDPEARLAELMRRRHEIDQEIERVAAGEVDVLDSAALRDRYQQVTTTAHGLLADFREVEANFRDLDRDLRSKIAAWDGAKGELLDEVLGSRESIAESDQGRTFQAFYDFLLAPSRQDELKTLLAAVEAMEAIGEPDPRMRRMARDWLEAAERTQNTVRQLSDQLRRFLDDQVRSEDRRVLHLVRGIETQALALRDVPGVNLVAEIDAAAPAIALPMERPLYTPLVKAPIDSTGIEAGDEEFTADALFEAVYVDPARLTAAVHHALGSRTQVSLAETLREHPLEQGLAELVAYFALPEDGFTTVFDDHRQEEITWTGEGDVQQVATVPVVTFARTSPGIAWVSSPKEGR
ncbi:DUF3375 domain-containing protein [Streptomyces sp. NBC_01571]|uniref:DUF3375 domain-containing protein n=1 Tax=Streptomyces sp. NBC_01571 TaxID=2975883 RepID=UPI0022581954|nr:DUF3375 domain-containing protein [Streptomyces sp. NBC_01571]MCX4579047.1 DUF3375 domain-containing protein [Streptomyces sp. NBC_01571]